MISLAINIPSPPTSSYLILSGFLFELGTIILFYLSVYGATIKYIWYVVGSIYCLFIVIANSLSIMSGHYKPHIYGLRLYSHESPINDISYFSINANFDGWKNAYFIAYVTFSVI